MPRLMGAGEVDEAVLVALQGRLEEKRQAAPADLENRVEVLL